ncbi:MAG: HlyC/CorC family transporter [Planctomycetes bacterium]|nr:HlyC/CorC family transporter [Planctomycetota bacterium]
MAMIEFIDQNATQLIIMAILLLLSGLFSGSETAIFSLKATDLNRLRKHGGPISGAILALHSNLGEFLMTVLFCNMIVNILFFATSTVVASGLVETYGPEWALIFGLLCLLIVITFGEVTPKTLATIAAPFFSRLAAIPMFALHRCLWWIRAILGSFVIAVERMVGFESVDNMVNPEELKLLVEMSRTDGIISADEHELIGEVIEFPEIRAKEIMTPRVDVVSATLNMCASEVLSLAVNHNHSKIPVRDENSDEYVGWIDARSVYVQDGNGTVAEHIEEPLFISELDRADQIFSAMRDTNCRLAIVVDERGSAAGVITMADLMSEIFGEFTVENDNPSEVIREEGENTYIIPGDTSVREWKNLFMISEELPPATTVGGLMIALLGHVPRKGNTITIGNILLEALSVSRRRIKRIRLTLAPREVHS